MGRLYHPKVAGEQGPPDNEAMTPSTPPPTGGLSRLIRSGGRWWMVAVLIGLGLGLIALVVLHALEYLAPFVYVAL